jgi:hypothetical protein
VLRGGGTEGGSWSGVENLWDERALLERLFDEPHGVQNSNVFNQKQNIQKQNIASHENTIQQHDLTKSLES